MMMLLTNGRTFYFQKKKNITMNLEQHHSEIFLNFLDNQALEKLWKNLTWLLETVIHYCKSLKGEKIVHI